MLNISWHGTGLPVWEKSNYNVAAKCEYLGDFYWMWFYKRNLPQQKPNHKIDKIVAVIQLSYHQVCWKIG